MKHTTLALSLVAALSVVAFSGCSRPEAPAAPSATAPAAPAASAASAQSYDAVVAQGRGFTVGAMMSANTVYVMFDPQCPHCGHLWEASLPLQKKVKFVWIPVSIINGKSAPQGAALLAAGNPAELMAAHEASILAGTGGIPAPASVAADVESAIKSNTQLFNSMKLESVPFIIAKNSRTAQVVTSNGSMSTPALAELLGVDQP